MNINPILSPNEYKILLGGFYEKMCFYCNEPYAPTSIIYMLLYVPPEKK